MLDEMTRLLQGATNKGIKTILENPDVKKFLIISELSLVQGVPKTWEFSDEFEIVFV